MAKPALKTIKEGNIRIALGQLFSEGELASKLHFVSVLRTLPGLSSFMTPLPWRINSVTAERRASGFSENLHAALKDIEAQLRLLSKIYPAHSLVSLEIDENRLSEAHQKASIRPVHGRQ
jgi:hypothetical protein